MVAGPEDADKVVALKKGEYMEHDEDVSVHSSLVSPLILYYRAWFCIYEPKLDSRA
jgi:hypothetical protein